MGFFWAEPAAPSSAARLPQGHPPIPSQSPQGSPPPGCPMHKRTVDALSTQSHQPPKSPSSSPLPPSSCPVRHGAPPSSSCCSDSPSSSQQDTVQSAQSTQQPSILSKLNPLNYMFSHISQAPAPNQTQPLPTSRDPSSIPRGSGDGNWEYPSPQQMYNALLRKGHTDTDITAVESMVQVHNFLNEGAWAEIVEWERRFGRGLMRGWQVCSRGEENALAMLRRQEILERLRARDAGSPGSSGAPDPTDYTPKLARFQGRPKDMTPKAAMIQALGRIYPSKFGTEPPFDRHDWFVTRTNPDGTTREVRYVIDYYSGPPEPTGEPVFYLDVRPAVTPTGAAERIIRWGGDVWWRASGGQARENEQSGPTAQSQSR